MLSKMSAQQQVGGGRRPPLSLSGAGGVAGGNSGLRSSQQAGNANGNTKSAQRAAAAAEQERKDNANAKSIAKQQQQNESKPERRESQNGVGKNNNGNDKTQNGANGNNAAATVGVKEKDNKERTGQTTKDNISEKKINFNSERKVKVDLKKSNANEFKAFSEKNAEKQKIDANRKDTEKEVDQVKQNDNEKEKVKEIEHAKKKDDDQTEKVEAVADGIIVIDDDAKSPTNTEVEKQKEQKSSNDNLAPNVEEPSMLASEQTQPQTPERRSSRKANPKITPTSTANKTIEQPQVQQPAATIGEKIDVDDNDVDMETLSVDASPIKAPPSDQILNKEVVNAVTVNNPTATSTPGKLFLNKPKAEIELAMQAGSSPDRKYYQRSFSQISGRRSIRQPTDFTPSKFQSNPNFRESYRRINTELDVTSNTNTSMNVTVGSEIPNNSSFSFSFFGRSRKRERTPPTITQSSTELHTDVDMSPPKRARIDKPGFFSGLIQSPMTALRSAFTKTSLQTPAKSLRLEQTPPGDEGEVQNVSGIHIEEELPSQSADVANTSNSANEDDVTVGNEAGLETPKKGSPIKAGDKDKTDAENGECNAQDTNVNDSIEEGEEEHDGDKDIEIKETFADDKKANRCSIM